MVSSESARIENLTATSFTTEKGCTISHNHIDIRPTNVSFNLQTTRVRHQTFPVGTKAPVARTPKSAPHPVSQSQPKPNVS